LVAQAMADAKAMVATAAAVCRRCMRDLLDGRP
jgi:hypothetical protein